MGFCTPKAYFSRCGIAINGAIQSQAQLVVHWRRRQDLDVIDHLLDAFDVLHDIFSVRLEGRPGDFTLQGNRIAFHLERDVVEDAEIRKHQQFMAYLFLNASLRRANGLSEFSLGDH